MLVIATAAAAVVSGKDRDRESELGVFLIVCV